MIDIRIVCTYDAVKTAQTLQRLLAAEDHNVELSHGRGSLSVFEETAQKRAAVLLIWSLDAPSAHYMLEWATRTDPTLLVEIARAPGALRIDGRKSAVIDFSNWSGERGGAAWRALVDRLRTVARATEPQKPPPLRAAMALGAASIAAVVGAVVTRVNDPLLPATETSAAASQELAEASTIELAQGGVLMPEEPASADDLIIAFNARRLRMQAMAAPHFEPLSAMPAAYEPIALRRETILERLTDGARSLINDVNDAVDGDEGTF
ncbi:hypothetical protein U91I_03947 [alpha proteobacterium U9-1i]|nr:hypothetical protein U91I_03947 [alpha proteobacterium U9-1i]